MGDAPITHPVMTLPPSAGYPPASIPTIYADMVISFSPGPQVVKYYLGRQDPSLAGDNTLLTQAVGQVVMGTQNFIQAVVFFEESIKILVAQNLISQEAVDAARKLITDALKSELRQPPKS